MNVIQFAGPIGSVLDNATGVTAHPLCEGGVQLDVKDPSAYGAGMARFGSEEALARAVQQTILKHLGAAFAEAVAAKGLLGAIGEAHLLTETARAGVDRELAWLGATVRIGNMSISLPPEDVASLKAAAAKKKQQQSASTASAPLAPGARVIARWNDGREFPATIQKWTGTHYEIVWDGGGSAFVGSDAVRPA